MPFKIIRNDITKKELIQMKTYEELLSDIEDDIELMGASHIVYSMEENNIITDYDYLPSDSCNISTTLKDLQENIRQQMLYAKVWIAAVSAHGSAVPWKAMLPWSGKEKVSANGVNRIFFTFKLYWAA